MRGFNAYEKPGNSKQKWFLGGAAIVALYLVYTMLWGAGAGRVRHAWGSLHPPDGDVLVNRMVQAVSQFFFFFFFFPPVCTCCRPPNRFRKDLATPHHHCHRVLPFSNRSALLTWFLSTPCLPTSLPSLSLLPGCDRRLLCSLRVVSSLVITGDRW